MRDRVKQLHDHYFKPKPLFHFALFDSAISEPAQNESSEGQAQAASIDIYVNLVV